jgi:hypothetical protein
MTETQSAQTEHREWAPNNWERVAYCWHTGEDGVMRWDGLLEVPDSFLNGLRALTERKVEP